MEYADKVCINRKKRSPARETKFTLGIRKYSWIGYKYKKDKNVEIMNEVILDGFMIQNIDGFTYLGSVLDGHGGCPKEIQMRICKAQNAFNLLRKTWASN